MCVGIAQHTAPLLATRLCEFRRDPGESFQCAKRLSNQQHANREPELLTPWNISKGYDREHGRGHGKGHGKGIWQGQEPTRLLSSPSFIMRRRQATEATLPKTSVGGSGSTGVQIVARSLLDEGSMLSSREGYPSRKTSRVGAARGAAGAACRARSRARAA
eukprot:6984060-Prymnesium_polylepis.1